MGNPPTLTRGAGAARVGKSNPYPYPCVPYLQSTWVWKPLTIPTHASPPLPSFKHVHAMVSLSAHPTKIADCPMQLTGSHLTVSLPNWQHTTLSAHLAPLLLQARWNTLTMKMIEWVRASEGIVRGQQQCSRLSIRFCISHLLYFHQPRMPSILYCTSYYTSMKFPVIWTIHAALWMTKISQHTKRITRW